jgi:hypothetical protein
VNRKGIKKSHSCIKRGVVGNHVAKFLVPDRGDIVDSDIKLSQRTDMLRRLAGGTTTLCQSRVDNSPQSGNKSLAPVVTAVLSHFEKKTIKS